MPYTGVSAAITSIAFPAGTASRANAMSHTPVSSICPLDGQDLDDMDDVTMRIDGIDCRE